MEDSPRQTIKVILADRPYLLLLMLVLACSVVYMLYAFFTIESRDIQVITQYSAFGEAQFYKEKWYYLYTFVGFGLVASVVNSGLMVKLYSLERRDFGVMVAIISLVLLLVAFRYTYEVMHFAFL